MTTACIDQIPAVIQAAKDKVIAREKLQPLFKAGWVGQGDQASYDVRQEFPRVWVSVSVDKAGDFDVFTPNTQCKVKSVAEVIEFAERLTKAVEEADLQPA